MGLLLKEVLKTLSANQWCYAVFWKIGCQNSKLLIWEDCYYEPKLRLQTGNTLQVLVNIMMMNNQVHLVGQGIVGRAAFTGNHEWILAENYIADAYPPEVLVEIRDQLSGGMQTIAVIPTPYGVVQLGSSFTIMENMGFVNNVKRLILQLECVPGALLSDNLVKESTERIGVPVSFAVHNSMSVHLSRNKVLKPSVLGANSGSQLNASSLPSTITQATQIQDNLTSTASTFSTLNLDNNLPTSRGTLYEPQMMSNVTPSFQGQLLNGAFKAEVLPSNPDPWLKKQPSSCNSSPFSHQSIIGQPCVSNNILTLLEQQVLSDTEPHNPINDKNAFLSANAGLIASSHGGPLALDVKHTENGTIAMKGKADDYLFQELNMLSSQRDDHKPLDGNLSSFFNYWPKHTSGSQSMSIASLNCEDPQVQPLSGDDLYDVLGADFKKNLYNSKLDSLIVDGPRENSQGDIDTSTFSFVQETSSALYSASQGISDCSFFTGMDSDHLLDAVVSRANSAANQSSDDNVSCKTTLTKIGGSSAPTGSPSYGLVDVSDHVQKDMPDCFEKSGIRTSSTLTSISGSQLSSWVSNNMKRDNSVSTAYSKKNDQTSKPSRKRMKPGENPRPRPKDRQMIQDRVKELREIVPNGAKCSIDALLERTIKHMLFLQSVTKHADKLKQTGGSKIIGKEGGLVLKDNFEGGATWAFEVGSQSMVCPIIVEDLNSPRQMLIEMLCEERGLFLEIADLIRGSGLTILKGIMEAQNDKIWARFAVEADRDVTRMEVFMSLVHLLEQTAKRATSSENNMMVHNSFSQPTSMIPATGSLQ